ncbi:MAG: B12-binding domain-containing radical SAM protein [Geobacteraceae bacterium]|nr:B12-binding domain-containing radical SAM protein [Geobacteraceae bacterium]
MSKILFIESDLRNEKLGIMYLSASLLNAGHETRLCWLERESIDEVIADFRPDYLAVSLVTGAHRSILSLTENLKKQYHLKVIAGGPHATFFADSIPLETADYIVVGPGEQAIVDIVEGRTGERVMRYPLADLEKLVFPDRALFYRYPEFRDNPMKNIITCRDCPYSCSYCYNHTWKQMFSGQPHFLQKLSVDRVLEEIAKLRSVYPLRQVLFIDDNFLFDRGWIEGFCKRYTTEIGLPFLCSFSLNLLDEGIVVLLKEAGLFMVNFALESADPAVQCEILNRGHVRNDQVIAGIELMRKYGIKCRMQNMIGLPVRDSLADALNTLEFNRLNRVDDSWVSIFQPYPNTRMAEYCARNGFIPDDGESYADSFFAKSCLQIDHADEIARLQKWWYFVIRYNLPEYTIHKLLKIRLTEAQGEALQKLRFEYSRCYLYGLDIDNPLLIHDFRQLSAQHGEKAVFKRLEGFVRRFGIGAGLVDIMLGLELPDSINGLDNL